MKRMSIISKHVQMLCSTICMFPPSRWPHVALAILSQNHGTMNIYPQLGPTEMEFWMASKTSILWLFRLHSQSWSMTGTKGERQGTKERKTGKGNRNISIIRREECYIRHVEGELPWIHTNLWVNNILRE